MKAERTASGSLTSHVTGRQSFPEFVGELDELSLGAGEQPERQPRAMQQRAMDVPIPFDAPVTTATLSATAEMLRGRLGQPVDEPPSPVSLGQPLQGTGTGGVAAAGSWIAVDSSKNVSGFVGQ